MQGITVASFCVGELLVLLYLLHLTAGEGEDEARDGHSYLTTLGFSLGPIVLSAIEVKEIGPEHSKSLWMFPPNLP